MTAGRPRPGAASLRFRLHPEEPPAGPWRVVPVAEVAATLLGQAGPVDGRPVVVGVDGRSSSGKTTVAGRLAATVHGAVVIHTDDVAWHHAFFDWADLLADGVLTPARQGLAVSYRPPAWDARGRTGAIEVPGGAAMLVVEGVGAARGQLSHLLDASLWVQSDLAEADRRNAGRVAAGEMTPSDFAAWMTEEVPFQAGQRSWERANLIVTGTPGLAHDPSTELVVADPPGREPG